MTEKHLIEQIVRRIRDVAAPDRIILFGSRARGTARPDSDYDFLVIRESDQPRHKRAIPLYAKLANLPVEVEVVVYTPDEVKDWSQVPRAFVSTAIREGTVLYERPS